MILSFRNSRQRRGSDMIERLARLTDRRARRIVIFAAVAFALAGVLGGGVAKRLDPFGADDPATESVIADQRLEHAGFRETGVVVLVRGADARSSQGRARIRAIARGLESDRDVASVSSFLSTGSRDFISREGDSTYLAVALKPTGDHARQDAAGRIAHSLAGRPGVTVGGSALAERQDNKQVERDLRTAELYAFPLLFLLSLLFFRSLVAALLPLIVGGLAIVGTFLMRRVDALAPGFLARRADRDARPAQEGFWYRLAQIVMRFPGRIAAAAATLLIALGLPFLGVQFTAVDAQVLPESASARQVDDTLRADFPPYRDTPVTLAVRGGAAKAARLAEAAARLPGAAAVRPPRRLADETYAVDVISAAPPLAGRSQQLVRGLRALDGDTLVTGTTAHYLDLQHSLGEHLPIALVIVAVLTIAVLFTMTGSLILPLKQVLMNGLGLG